MRHCLKSFLLNFIVSDVELFNLTKRHQTNVYYRQLLKEEAVTIVKYNFCIINDLYIN